MHTVKISLCADFHTKLICERLLFPLFHVRTLWASAELLLKTLRLSSYCSIHSSCLSVLLSSILCTFPSVKLYSNKEQRHAGWACSSFSYSIQFPVGFAGRWWDGTCRQLWCLFSEPFLKRTFLFENLLKMVLHFIILELFLFSYFNVCICFPFDAFRNVIHCLGCLYMCNVFYHEPDFLPFSLHIQLFLIL